MCQIYRSFLLYILILTALLTGVPFAVSAEEQTLSETNEDDSAGIDISTIEEGFISALYQGNAASARAEVTDPVGRLTAWPLTPGENVQITLGGGDGTYRIRILENTGGEQYALIFASSFDAVLPDPLSPFLHPSLFVPWTGESLCAEKAQEIYEECAGNEEAFTEAVYAFIISEIAYDSDVSAEVPADYVPDPDRTLRTKLGICYDYASLMAAMLRSCGVPARVLSGFFGDYRHAFVQAAPGASSGNGTVRWKAFDPALGACNTGAAVRSCLNQMDTYYLIRQIY